MASIPVILMVLAVVLLALAAFKIAPEPPHVAYGWAGLFVWALVQLVYGVGGLIK